VGKPPEPDRGATRGSLTRNVPGLLVGHERPGRHAQRDASHAGVASTGGRRGTVN